MLVADLRGCGAAVPTFLDAEQLVLAGEQGLLAKMLVEQGADLILVAGTTGRGDMLNLSQRAALVEASATAGAPVICGVPSSIRTMELELLGQAGASAVLVAFDPKAGLSCALKTVERARYAGVEPVAYHHPRHREPLPSAWYGKLAAEYVKVKNSDPDRETFDRMHQAGLRVLVGSTPLLAETSAVAVGVLSGLGAVAFPTVRASASGDMAAQDMLLALERGWHSDRVGEVERRALDWVRARSAT